MKAIPTSQVTFQVQLHLAEDEARALDAVCGYEPSAFLAIFYERLGKAYLQPHADGFRRLTEQVLSQIRPQLSQVDEARRVLRGERVEHWRMAGAASLGGLIAMAEAIRSRLDAEQREKDLAQRILEEDMG